MDSYKTFFLAVIFLGSIFFFDTESRLAKNDKSLMPASVFFTQSITATGLRNAFNAVPNTGKKLNILIIPGHEPDFGGAEYQNIKERDLNVELAQELVQYLRANNHYNVILARTKDDWNPILQNYFTTHDTEIKTFIRAQKVAMVHLIDTGKIPEATSTVPHNFVPEDVGIRLFAINKWANENKIDMTINIHFNDSSPRERNTPGEHNGFTIYVPDNQFSNAAASMELAKSVFARLSKMFPTSDLPEESSGIIPDRDLIAIGSDNSLDAASMLIEYGYIYEPQFKIASVRAMVLKELAFRTYLGLSDFFGETPLVAGSYDSTLLPYDGASPLKKTESANKDVFAFQAALADRGFYPPQNTTRNDCPLSGIFGKCTRTAIAAFQEKFNIKNEQGIAGSKTREQLRELFQ